MSKKTYEYQAVESSTPAEIIEQTARLGRASWELVNVVYTEKAQQYVAFLKRKVRHGKHRDENEPSA